MKKTIYVLYEEFLPTDQIKALNFFSEIPDQSLLAAILEECTDIPKNKLESKAQTLIEEGQILVGNYEKYYLIPEALSN